MKKEYAMKWADALESGKYKQGLMVLQHEDSYCCLGVLCDIVRKEAPVEVDPTTRTICGETLSHQLHVKRLTGVKDSQGILPGKTTTGLSRKLTTINDDGYDFNYIAKLIRKHWRYL